MRSACMWPSLGLGPPLLGQPQQSGGVWQLGPERIRWAYSEEILGMQKKQVTTVISQKLELGILSLIFFGLVLGWGTLGPGSIS